LSIRKLATILIVALGGATAFAAPPLPCNSLSDYRALLEHVGEASELPDTKFDKLLTDIPADCKFEVGGKHFQITTSQL